jgi:mannose-P-dolichol utilization defect protein 1
MVSASKLLSVVVVTGASVSKLSQILQIIKAKSTRGLTITMFMTELMVQMVTAWYHAAKSFPLLTYAENIALALQNVLILYLKFRFGDGLLDVNDDPRVSATLQTFDARSFVNWGSAAQAKLSSDTSKPSSGESSSVPFHKNNRMVIFCFVASGWFLLSLKRLIDVGGLPNDSALMRLLEVLQGLSIPVLSFSRGYQVLQNWIRGDTGELNALPFALNLLGSLARIVTTMTELKGDKIVFAGFVSSIMLNATLIIQILISARKKALAKQKQK